MIDRDRETFLLEVVLELADSLDNSIGRDDAEGFVSLVGTRVAGRMNADYRQSADGNLTQELVQEALVDLKRRIGGQFRVARATDEVIELVNSRCPFGEDVLGSEVLCMMTSTVFGRIVADNLGYARIEIADAIARGSEGCRVLIHLKEDDDEGDSGKEYFG